VIVISANMGCAYCRERVSQTIAKVTGLKEYTLDVRNKQVIVKGDVRLHGSLDESFGNKKDKKKCSLKVSVISGVAWFIGCLFH
ncbi:hypothetical protein RJ640_012835, partial [Escallonia rubra]